MWKSTANKILRETQLNYDLIAAHFSETRRFIWKDFLLLKKYFSKKMRLLDLGCGNGRLIDLIKDFEVLYTGVDISKNLLNEARLKYPSHDFVKADALNLPFSDASFDMVVSIAMLHHIPSKELRINLVREMKRVLRPGGLVIVSVWNIARIKPYRKYFYWSIFRAYFSLGKYDVGDTFIPWKDQRCKVMAERYYFVFSLGSLARLFLEEGFILKESFGAHEGNYCSEDEASNLFLIAQKP